ncbi:MAG: tetratricopeptide repeat protein [Ruminococcus sp.]|nr:tetratricopeptide repeat protein [Ruminococcus sp.]
MSISAFAAEPYESYIYDTWQDAIPSQNSYRIDRTVTGYDMGLQRLSDPEDPLFVSENAAKKLANPRDLYFDDDEKQFWIADTDNNRIIRLDEDLQITGCYYSVGGSTFSAPTGLYVKRSLYTDKLYIYIADTNNSRIIKASVEGDMELEMVKEYGKPDTDLYTVETFNPSKVVADAAENVYAVCSAVNQGAVQFNAKGAFQGYYGANRVEVTAAVIAQKLWRKFASNEQIDGMKRNVPVEYANFDIDEGGFIYTVTEKSNTTTDAVKKLNPAGYNIWDNVTGNEYKFGDMQSEWDPTSNSNHSTRLTDICVGNNGLINVLDYTTGRVFQYDRNANLLCIFGAKNSTNDQRGTFSNPNAVEAYKNNIYVIDGAKCDITIYSETTFGKLMHEAVELYDEGKYTEAKPVWQSVIERDGGYPLAYIGLGKAALNDGEYQKALDYFKAAYDQKDYDKAFKYAREEYIREHFTAIVVVLAVLAVLLVVVSQMHKRNKYIFKGRFKKKAKEGR